MFFFFKQKTAYEMRISDWSSDVCSSDLGMEVETICRYNLPVCVVIFNNDGIYRGTDVNAASADPATTAFVKGARYDRMMEAFGGEIGRASGRERVWQYV